MSFTWNSSLRRFENDGEIISDKQLREWVFAFVDNYKEHVRGLTQDLIDEKINLPAWQISMSEAIKATRLDAAMAAHGGRDAMTQKEWGRVGVEIREELRYLRAFALDIQNGKVPLDGRTAARSELYIEGATNYYENQVTARERAAGVTMGQRILEDGADHCDDCLAAANADPVSIDDIVAIGDSECGARCRCYIQYEDGATED